MKKLFTFCLFALAVGSVAVTAAPENGAVKISYPWGREAMAADFQTAVEQYYTAFAVNDAAAISAMLYAPEIATDALVAYQRPVQWGVFDAVHILRSTRLMIDGQPSYLLSGIYGDSILQTSPDRDSRSYLYTGFQDVWILVEGRWVCVPGERLAGSEMELPDGAGQWTALTPREFAHERAAQQQEIETLKLQRQQAVEAAVQRAKVRRGLMD